MKVDTRYLLLSGIGVMILVAAIMVPTQPINNQNELLGQPADSARLGSMIPDDVTIEGTIIDSYVDVSYTMSFDNTASTEASEIAWPFELQDGVRLSNVSVVIGNQTYWGKVMPEQTAVQEYHSAVEENRNALLVVKIDEGYMVKFNLEKGIKAIVTVSVEGLLARKLGIYSIDLPIAGGVPISTRVILDLSIRSNFDAIAGYSIRGLPSFTASDLTNGVKIVFASSSVIDVESLEVRYTLNRQLGGSQLLTYTNGTDSFFVYLLAPSITTMEESAHRQYVFILDKSGSMSGTKLEQARSAFNSMIETLQPTDLFNVIAFDTEISTLWIEPHSAAESSIEEAQTWVASINAGGSTNFHGAMMEGLGMMSEGENVKALLMLSDGIPTAGSIVDSAGILSAVQTANDLGVSISTVAFGSDSDENLMANLAAQNEGFFVFIQPSEESAVELVEFYYEFATPIAESYSIEFEGILDRSTLMPLNESPFFNGSEIVVCGRYDSSMVVHTTIEYPDGNETYLNIANTPTTENPHIEKLWAQHRITYLLRLVRLEGETPALRKEIVNLGMNYGIIVEGYTALLITTDEPVTTSESVTGTSTTSIPPPAATYTGYTDAPTGTTATAAPTTYAASGGVAFDASLSIVAGAFGFALVMVAAVIIFLWKRFT